MGDLGDLTFIKEALEDLVILNHVMLKLGIVVDLFHLDVTLPTHTTPHDAGITSENTSAPAQIQHLLVASRMVHPT